MDIRYIDSLLLPFVPRRPYYASPQTNLYYMFFWRVFVLYFWLGGSIKVKPRDDDDDDPDGAIVYTTSRQPILMSECGLAFEVSRALPHRPSFIPFCV